MRDDVIKALSAAIDGLPGIELKGKNMLYTSANGHMFSLINKEGQLGIRLAPEEQKAFHEAHNAAPFKSHGANMRGYVCLPDEMALDVLTITKYLKLGHAYVLSLEPK